MMKEKLDEQQRQLQQQLSKYENNQFDEFEQAFEEKDAEETPMENQDDQLCEVEPTINHQTEEDIPAKPNKGFAIDITSMDEEGTLKLRKLKKLEEMKRKKIEDLEKRKRDHTPTQHKGDKSPN